MAVSAAFRLSDPRDVLTLGVGMLALAIIGWLDDTRGMRAGVRLTIHFAVAIWTVYMFGGLPAVRIGVRTIPLGLTGYLVSALGVVWGINLFNFMDGIDGIAGSQAVLILTAVATLSFARGSQSIGFIAVIIAGGTAGFLFWNWPPAKIFMGDVASGAMGYLIAGLAIASENRGAVPLIAFAIMGGAFVADATITLIRRFRRRERLAAAHRDHAYQRLARAWHSHRPVTEAAAGITLALIGLAVFATLDVRLVVPAVALASLLLGAVLFAVERRAPL
jgi:Fuc2NAc and GlcNAc transferase